MRYLGILNNCNGEMVSTIYTTAITGMEAIDITVQTHICNGIPCFNIVGLPDKTVAESRERIKAAFSSSGIAFPQKRVTVNLSPADLFKIGSHYDLPIALGILAGIGVVPYETTKNAVFIGELGLDGSILPVCGVLPTLIHASKKGMTVVCPEKNSTERYTNSSGIYVDTLSNVIGYLNGNYMPSIATIPSDKSESEYSNKTDMQDVKGQILAKTAMEIAAAGKHNVAMIGPPGVGKSMLARAFISILPDLYDDEMVEVNIISSVVNGKSYSKTSGIRPFRDPHHTLSVAAMIGGGTKYIKPGEVTLAHCGVLFLDELPEFQRDVLESLRQPLENKFVKISRVSGAVNYPSNFQLIAAMNPCHCGYAGKQKQRCKDSSRCKVAYFNKISGPLLDRIDICVHVQDVNPLLHTDSKPATSKEIKTRVLKARSFQLERYKNLPFKTNGDINSQTIEELIMPTLEANALNIIKSLAEKHDISARGIYKIIRLSRTIADLRLSGLITKEDAAEAAYYCSANVVAF